MLERDIRLIRVSIQIIIILLTTSISLQFFFSHTNAQHEIQFNTAHKFEIPKNNGSISFGFEGAYTKAYLEDNMWNFENLRDIDSDETEKYNLKVSVEDSQINITSFRIYNRVYMEENTTRARLLYQVNGHGTQAFKLELNPDEGDYGAVIDGIFESLNHGWKLSPEGQPIITGAKEYAIISYYGYLPSYINRKSSIEEHSVFIASTIFFTISIIFASFISVRKKNKNLKENRSKQQWSGKMTAP